jgi:hypothetical protein
MIFCPEVVPRQHHRGTDSHTGDWLAALDDFRKWLIREAA